MTWPTDDFSKKDWSDSWGGPVPSTSKNFWEGVEWFLNVSDTCNVLGLFMNNFCNYLTTWCTLCLYTFYILAESMSIWRYKMKFCVKIEPELFSISLFVTFLVSLCALISARINWPYKYRFKDDKRFFFLIHWSRLSFRFSTFPFLFCRPIRLGKGGQKRRVSENLEYCPRLRVCLEKVGTFAVTPSFKRYCSPQILTTGHFWRV